jgi:4-hydroxybenzoate polyprenyltransferase
MSLKKALDYLGQLRIYSLLDLAVLLIAAGAGSPEFSGAILLHIAFLAYLESRHSHEYRAEIPRYMWTIPAIVGMILFGHIAFALLFILLSFFYTLKNKGYWAAFAPLARGLQYFFLIAALTGFSSHLPWIALGVTFIRNLLGDMRDTDKDRAKGMKTIPVLMRFPRSIRHIHLIATMISTLIWWSYTSIPFYWILLILIIQLSSYELTSR